MRVRLIDRSPALDLTGDRVEGEVLERHHFGIGVQIGRGATQKCTQPGKQLFQSEGLGQVVVRSGIEAGDSLADRIAGGEHEDGQVVAGTTKTTAHFESVESRHHDVEHDGVWPVGEDLLECVEPVDRELDRVAVEAERPPKRLANRPVVVDHQNTHTDSLD